MFPSLTWLSCQDLMKLNPYSFKKDYRHHCLGYYDP